MIIEKYKRASLNEGRQYGLGYAILKKVSNNYETCNAFSACKDYLNDLVYIENTGLTITKTVHGFSHKQQDIFKGNRYFYLGVCPIDYKSSTEWNLFKECTKILLNNFKYLLLHINKLEDHLNLGKSRTTIETIDDIQDHNNKAIIFKVPKYWSKNPILLSLYTLFIRCTFHIEGNVKLDKLLHKDTLPFLSSDNYLKKELNEILNVKNIKKYFNIYEYNMDIKSLSNIHNYGISSWLKKLLGYLNGKEKLKTCW